MGHGTRGQVAYRFERFTLDASRGALLGAEGAELPLRPKSFALLRHLVEHAGRAVDRAELMAAVWPGLHVTDDSVVQCVGDIRRALGDEGQRLLRTLLHLAAFGDDHRAAVVLRDTAYLSSRDLSFA